jgi:hypothetical protein
MMRAPFFGCGKARHAGLGRPRLGLPAAPDKPHGRAKGAGRPQAWLAGAQAAPPIAPLREPARNSRRPQSCTGGPQANGVGLPKGASRQTLAGARQCCRSPTCGTLSQLSMIGRVTPAAGVPLVSRRHGRRPRRVLWAINRRRFSRPARRLLPSNRTPWLVQRGLRLNRRGAASPSGR